MLKIIFRIKVPLMIIFHFCNKNIIGDKKAIRITFCNFVLIGWDALAIDNLL